MLFSPGAEAEVWSSLVADVIESSFYTKQQRDKMHFRIRRQNFPFVSFMIIIVMLCYAMPVLLGTLTYGFSNLLLLLLKGGRQIAKIILRGMPCLEGNRGVLFRSSSCLLLLLPLLSSHPHHRHRHHK